ncbi:MAG: substrate-binding domain-containing protein [Candidatus Competibacteraceae bacterium]
MLNRWFFLVFCGLIAWIPLIALAQPDTPNKDKIALVMKALSNPFFFKMEAGAKDYARENHLTLEVFGTELETDLAHQASILNNLISRGYGAIVIAPADSRTLDPILKKAVDQGIVVINIDNPLDKTAQAEQGLDIPFVGSDNAKGAALVGDYFRRQLQGRGRLIVIEGIPGAQNGDLRKSGFIQAVTAGGGIEIVDSVSANWQTEDAFAVMSNLLEKHGSVDAVFCANDQMALGVLHALDLRNLTGKVRVGGYDNIEAIRNELRNGRVDATVEQHPELMGRYGVALAAQAMQGKKIPTYQETPLALITHESFGKRIALTLSDLKNPFFAAMLKGAQTQAEVHGVDLSYADAGNDDSQQLLTLQNFVDKKADLIIINPTNSQAVRPGIDLANRARIPVITVDRKAYGGQVVSQIASDNVAGGRLVGEYLVRKLDNGGAIAEFEGIPGASASYERGKGFNDDLADHKNLRVATREIANFNRDDARAAMTQLLTQNQHFAAIFAHNDTMILGIMDAFHAHPDRQRPLLVGFDAIPEALQALHEGKIAATVAQRPDRMGALAVETAIRVLRGESPPPTIAVELDLIEASQ